MSQENVEIVRNAVERFKASGELSPETAATDVAWHDPPDFPDAKVHFGMEGVIEALGAWANAWSEWQIELDDYVDAGERVLVRGRQWGRGKDTGMRVEQPLCLVYLLPDATVIEVRAFFDEQQALEAAGLSEKAMYEENVEVVRRYFESLNRWLASYWSEPVLPIERSPELEEVFDHLDPEAEWDWLFSPETFRGREQLLQAVADWLETVGDWRVEIEKLIDGSRDRVLLIGRVVARGKGSGVPVLQPIFVAVTVRNGKVARIEDYTERAEALEAAGLSE